MSHSLWESLTFSFSNEITNEVLWRYKILLGGLWNLLALAHWLLVPRFSSFLDTFPKSLGQWVDFDRQKAAQLNSEAVRTHCEWRRMGSVRSRSGQYAWCGCLESLAKGEINIADDWLYMLACFHFFEFPSKFGNVFTSFDLKNPTKMIQNCCDLLFSSKS
jgi:hypothetical protein